MNPFFLEKENVQQKGHVKLTLKKNFFILQVSSNFVGV